MNLISISYGTFAGWPSASSLTLHSAKDSPLESGALTTDQLSWIGSLLGAGGLCGSIFFVWLSNRVGRKIALGLVAIPAIVSPYNIDCCIDCARSVCTRRVADYSRVFAMPFRLAGALWLWPRPLCICMWPAFWADWRRAARLCWFRCLSLRSPRIGKWRFAVYVINHQFIQSMWECSWFKCCAEFTITVCAASYWADKPYNQFTLIKVTSHAATLHGRLWAIILSVRLDHIYYN